MKSIDVRPNACRLPLDMFDPVANQMATVGLPDPTPDDVIMGWFLPFNETVSELNGIVFREEERFYNWRRALLPYELRWLSAWLSVSSTLLVLKYVWAVGDPYFLMRALGSCTGTRGCGYYARYFFVVMYNQLCESRRPAAVNLVWPPVLPLHSFPNSDGSSLSGTYIGPAGAIVLAGGMATNCTVQQLHLARVGVGGVGTAALARSVTGHPALRLLDLSWNVGDVDEGYAKRDRLEELEAAQAKVGCAHII